MSNSDVSTEKLYELNERVLCSHTDNLFYDAKVVDVRTTETGMRMYTIHYKGWNVRFDEEFDQSKARFRIRKFNEEAYEKAKEELKEAREKAKKPLKKGSKSGSHKRKSLPGGVTAATGTLKRGRGRPSLSSISTKSSNEERANSAQLELESVVKANTLKDGGSISPIESDSVHRTVPVYLSEADRPFYDFESTTLPSRIKEILREDLKRALEGETVVKVPARCSISRILSEYAKEVRKTDAQYGKELALCNPIWKAAGRAMDDCCNNIKDTFDVFIGTELLTERENERHRRLINSGIITTRRAMFGVHSGKLRACDVYGFVHLLRFLVFSHDHPRALGNMSKEVVDAFKGTHLMLAVYLTQNIDRFFDIDQAYVPNMF